MRLKIHFKLRYFSLSSAFQKNLIFVGICQVNVIVECTNSILRLIQNNSLGSITIFRLQNLLTREDSYSNILTGEYRHFGENSSDLTMQIFSLESTSKKREDAMIEEDEI